MTGIYCMLCRSLLQFKIEATSTPPAPPQQHYCLHNKCFSQSQTAMIGGGASFGGFLAGMLFILAIYSWSHQQVQLVNIFSKLIILQFFHRNYESHSTFLWWGVTELMKKLTLNMLRLRLMMKMVMLIVVISAK